MTDQGILERITLDPKMMVGKPVIRGTRLTVEFILTSSLTARQRMKSWRSMKGSLRRISRLASYSPPSRWRIRRSCRSSQSLP